VVRNLEIYRGTEVKSTGDGTLATFDGPARAIQCACALRDSSALLGFSLRSGLHTGEVLVSRTVTDLVAGSGIEFIDMGQHELRGIPGSWHLFEASS
jgi:class 3 adenylate cyclase